jgi:hypothetical protein
MARSLNAPKCNWAAPKGFTPFYPRGNPQDCILHDHLLVTGDTAPVLKSNLPGEAVSRFPGPAA